MSSVTRYPTTNAVGTTGFTNAGNAYSSNDSYATAAPGTLNTISSYFGGFDFASYIPSGATINSVTVYCERKFSTTASNASSTLRPYNLTTALAAENENTTEPTSDTEYSVNFGALGVTDVRSADFRILVGAKRGSGSTGYTYSLDVVYVTVDYTSGAYSLTCDYASLALSGQAASLFRSLKLSCGNASLTLTGQIAALLRSRIVACAVGSLYLVGQSATLTYTPVGTNYPLTCDHATLTLSGQAAALNRGRYILCGAVYLSATGQIAALLRSKIVACAVGSLYLVGQSATLTYTPGSTYSLTCDHASLNLTGQASTLIHTAFLVCNVASITIAPQSVTFSVNQPLTCDHASLVITGQSADLINTLILVCNVASITVAPQSATLAVNHPLACTYAGITISGQDITFEIGHVLICTYAGVTLTGQNITLFYLSETIIFPCLYGSYNVSGQSVQFFVELWEPSGDMITLGTLLTRIQSALGDTSGAIWNRTEVIWPFACDAIRDFPILRPKTNAYTLTEAGHSFTLPSDFRKLIYVEFPPYQDPPEYLQRKAHLGTDFFGEDGFCDVDRDYDSGGDYILWISNSLIVGDIVIVRYLATHTTEFANEYSYITIENQYVQVIINHVVLMCYQERLAHPAAGSHRPHFHHPANV